MNDDYSVDALVVSALEKAGRQAYVRHANALAGLLVHDGKSVCLNARLGAGTLPCVMAAMSQWLVSNPEGKALVLVAHDQDAAGATRALEPFAQALGFNAVTAGRDSGQPDARARVLVATPDTLSALLGLGSLDASVYGLVLITDLDAVLDRQGANTLRSLKASLMSQWQRRTLALSSRFGVKERNLVLDISDAPAELCLEEADERLKAIPSRSWAVDGDDKLKLLIGLLRNDPVRPAAVFCNLKDGAADLAQRLRANGFGVEYVLGNLQRKHAILDEVLAGKHELLVLTDEGAHGLRPAWAARVYNVDIPLEGEPYLKRLEALNGDADGASVTNFVCDRYSMGLPAIDRLLGQALTVVPADASMFAADDLSAGMVLPPPHRPDGSDRGPRVNPAEDSRRQERGNPERGGSGRDRGRDNGGRYDGRNAHAIQADIAALTGGRVAERPAQNQSARDGRGADQDKAPGDASRRDRRSGGHNAGRHEQGQNSRQDAGHGGKRKGGRGGQDASRDGGKGGSRSNRGGAGKSPRNGKMGSGRDGAARPADPYALPMEERMKLYRERYGSKVSGKQDASAGRRGKRRGDGKAPAPVVDSSASAAAAPAPQQNVAGREKPKGFLGAVRRLFGARDED